MTVKPWREPEHNKHVQQRDWHFVTCPTCHDLLEFAQRCDSYNQYAREGMNNTELLEAYLFYREKMSES